jgi:hypothetical protein
MDETYSRAIKNNYAQQTVIGLGLTESHIPGYRDNYYHKKLNSFGEY